MSNEAREGLPSPGFLVVLSGPSGAGKTTLRRRLLADDPSLVYSISVTTRAPRNGEADGQDYSFVSPEQFEEWRRRNAFAEWAVVHGNRYGTPRAPIDRVVAEGRIVLLDVDVQGGQQLRAAYENAVFVFVLPPSMRTLERRLRERHTEADDSLRGRLLRAAEEVDHVKDYGYAVVNDDFERACGVVRAIIEAERHKVGRLLGGSMPLFLEKMRGE